MTTIAYKDGMIAYDSQVTRGDSITDDAYEKCIEQKGVRFFCAGPVSDHQRLVDVYFGAKPEGNIDASALVADGESLMHVAVDDTTGLWKTPILHTRVYAIGSGSAFAFTAMDMGATAYQAVGMAAKRDTNTGGAIRTFLVTSPAQAHRSPVEFGLLAVHDGTSTIQGVGRCRNSAMVM